MDPHGPYKDELAGLMASYAIGNLSYGDFIDQKSDLDERYPTAAKELGPVTRYDPPDDVLRELVRIRNTGVTNMMLLQGVYDAAKLLGCANAEEYCAMLLRAPKGDRAISWVSTLDALRRKLYEGEDA